MRVIYCEVDTEPRVVEIDGSLESMQDLVHGYIEEFPLKDALSIVCNEEGKLVGMNANAIVYNGSEPLDVINGDYFITACGAKDFRTLTDAEVEQALDIFGGYKKGVHIVRLVS